MCTDGCLAKMKAKADTLNTVMKALLKIDKHHCFPLSDTFDKACDAAAPPPATGALDPCPNFCGPDKILVPSAKNTQCFGIKPPDKAETKAACDALSGKWTTYKCGDAQSWFMTHNATDFGGCPSVKAYFLDKTSCCGAPGDDMTPKGDGGGGGINTGGDGTGPAPAPTPTNTEVMDTVDLTKLGKCTIDNLIRATDALTKVFEDGDPDAILDQIIDGDLLPAVCDGAGSSGWSGRGSCFQDLMNALKPVVTLQRTFLD